MRKTKAKKIFSEDDIDLWIDSVDLSKSVSKFKPASFPNLKLTNWDKFYQDQQVMAPVSLPLPQYFVSQIKQRATGLGIPYQYLIRLWIAEKLGLQARMA